MGLPAIDDHDGDLAGDGVNFDGADFGLERCMFEAVNITVLAALLVVIASIAAHATLPRLWTYVVMDSQTAASRVGDQTPMGWTTTRAYCPWTARRIRRGEPQGCRIADVSSGGGVEQVISWRKASRMAANAWPLHSVAVTTGVRSSVGAAFRLSSAAAKERSTSWLRSRLVPRRDRTSTSC